VPAGAARLKATDNLEASCVICSVAVIFFLVYVCVNRSSLHQPHGAICSEPWSAADMCSTDKKKKKTAL